MFSLYLEQFKTAKIKNIEAQTCEDYEHRADIGIDWFLQKSVLSFAFWKGMILSRKPRLNFLENEEHMRNKCTLKRTTSILKLSSNFTEKILLNFRADYKDHSEY